MPNNIIAEIKEHDFAQYIRILGKGKTGSRSLNFDEAKQAMQMILEKKVTGEQIGAFLMLLRVKEESPEELAGFVSACRKKITADKSLSVDIDWSSYAGKRRFLPYYLLAALCLADNGHRVLMHGSRGHTSGRVYSEDVLKALGQTTCNDWSSVEQALNQNNFAFIALQNFCPVLQEMMEMRNLFGLRSPVHSLARLLNPASAPYTLQSIFHPAYAKTHQQAAEILAEHGAVVFKGEAGEFERKPDATCEIFWTTKNGLKHEKWPRLIKDKREWETPDDIDVLINIWRNDRANDSQIKTILGTLAIVLETMQLCSGEQQSMDLALSYWNNRNRDRI